MTDAPSEMTPARRLFVSTLSRLGRAIPLTEQFGGDNGPWRILTSHAPFHQGACGDARLFSGPGLFKIVTCSISAPAIGLDSHMLFAFTPSQLAIPHFTVDSVQSGDHMAFHLDLIPRLDLATHLPYMDWAFGGINDTFAAAADICRLVCQNDSAFRLATRSAATDPNSAPDRALGAVEISPIESLWDALHRPKT